MKLIQEIRETTGLALPLAIGALYSFTVIYTTVVMIGMATNS